VLATRPDLTIAARRATPQNCFLEQVSCADSHSPLKRRHMAIADPAKLLTTLCSQPRETEWLEFKQNKFSPEETAEYVCALANSAMLKNEPHAYLVFGVEDESHDVVGTRVRLKREKVGAEPFENWLSRALDPRITVTFVELEFEGKHVEIIIIDPAYQRPVRFKTEAFIRIDSVQKKLRDSQKEKERCGQLRLASRSNAESPSIICTRKKFLINSTAKLFLLC
jgi:predicted HTH transcriptional regulator